MHLHWCVDLALMLCVVLVRMISACLFALQDGIEPMWEDERNRKGGRWLITLNKQQRKLDLDRFWLETVSILMKLFI